MKKIKFIDLFSGLGGFRIGFENACRKLKIESECILSSEIKTHAIDTYGKNFKDHNLIGDITKLKASEIPNFDILLAGFPCQSFSSAGSRRGFLDTRGTLFFEIERILKAKKPKGFILENVEGLVKHDLKDKNKKIGQTLETILKILTQIGYKVSWKLLNSKNFNLPQDRNRIFIVGTKKTKISLENFKDKKKPLKDILEKKIHQEQSEFFKLLLRKYSPKDLYGKSIKDKRGGKNNIHSWDLEVKGKISKTQKQLLNELLKQRRRKEWSIKNKVEWMDGMPLTIDQIHSFFGKPTLFDKGIEKKELRNLLNDLAKKGYVNFEHPKKIKMIKNEYGIVSKRVENFKSKKGYNIVVGKLSFEISKILDPNGITPTLLATDMDRLAVIDTHKLRNLTINECKKLFGFPKNYKVNLNQRKAYNLFGESIAIPVVEKVAEQVLQDLE